MTVVFAGTALLEDGWRQDVRVTIGPDGRIASVTPDASPQADDLRLDRHALLPAPVNLHSHTFQRAMAGMTERRSGAGHDNFWTWREVMYRFVSVLEPEHVEAISAMAQVEMLESGFGSEVEFHYLHNQPDGTPYDDPAELCGSIVRASETTGIGLTLLPVYYALASSSGAPLYGGQRRFRTDLDAFQAIWEGAKSLGGTRDDDRLGIAPHSLRAVSAHDLARLVELHRTGPIHIHAAEQTGEVDEAMASYGKRPVEWLCDTFDVNERWCLIHATHVTEAEVATMVGRGAVAGLCPVTEANLGDGVFPTASFLRQGGRLGVGTDSNVSIDLAREMRTLEYAQRLTTRSRSVLATPEASTGRTILEAVCRGGAAAAARDTGAIAVGRLADLCAVNTEALPLLGHSGDALIDSWIFAATGPLVTDTWSAGRHVVRDGRHVARDAVERRYRQTMAEVTARF